MQVMPFIEDEVLNKLEENIQNIRSVTSMLDHGHTPEEMLAQVLEGLDLEITDTMQLFKEADRKGNYQHR